LSAFVAFPDIPVAAYLVNAIGAHRVTHPLAADWCHRLRLRDGCDLGPLVRTEG
jgi:hypothetical protein